MFYSTLDSTYFIYGYMVLGYIVKDHLDSERNHYMGYSFRLAAKNILRAPSNRRDHTDHDLCYIGCGALAGNSSSSQSLHYDIGSTP